MKTTVIAAASLIFAGIASQALAATDAETCKFVSDTVKGFNGKGPHMVDKVTRAEKATADCAAKTADFKLSILLESAKMNAGWQDTLKTGWAKGFCASAPLKDAIKAGWKVTANWATQDGVTYQAETACP